MLNRYLIILDLSCFFINDECKNIFEKFVIKYKCYKGVFMSNLLIKNANELVTCSGKTAKYGKEMSDIHVIEDGAVVIEDGIIKDLGKTADILSKYDEKKYEVIDASGDRKSVV